MRDFVDDYIELAQDCEGWVEESTAPDFQNLLLRWETVSTRMFAEWGWNATAINDLVVEWGNGKAWFNWNKLHPPDIKNLAQQDVLDKMRDFASELMYCSDRMCLNRWMRCHVLMNHLGAFYYRLEKTEDER